MKWTSVNSARPKPCKRVLCLHESGEICIEAMMYDDTFYFDELYGPVTHWMPLPKPPRGRDNS